MNYRLWACMIVTIATAAQAAPEWTTHRDPAGFSVQLPAGWSVGSNVLTDIAIGDAQARATALIRARVARGDFAQWLSNHYAATEPGMGQARLEQVKASGPDVVHGWVSYVNQKGTAKRGRVVAVRRGEMATVFVAAAPAEELKASLPILARVIDSLRFEAPKAGAKGKANAPVPLKYAQWVDPREQAFTVDLPAGWRNEGGLQRTTWNRRVAFVSTSPDGAATLFSGDGHLPRMFILPNQTTEQFGGGMNQEWSADAQIILPFQSAEQMGAFLVQRRFNGQVTGATPRPDLVQLTQHNPLLQQGLSAATAADVEFRLSDGRVGVLTLTTFGGQASSVGGSWWADGIHGFIAPASSAAQTGAALARMMGSFRINPNWAAGEREHERRMGKQWTDYLAHSARVQQQTIEQRWAADEAKQRGMRDILGGTVRLQDPQTGEVFETAARDRYYYRVNPADQPTAIGTDTDFNLAPQLDLRRLLQIGVEVPDR
jgi:hypothetical protein